MGLLRRNADTDRPDVMTHLPLEIHLDVKLLKWNSSPMECAKFTSLWIPDIPGTRLRALYEFKPIDVSHELEHLMNRVGIIPDVFNIVG